MDDKNIVINLDSINSTKQLMDSECEKLLNMINQYKTMFEETKEIYDTDSAIFYRKIAVSYLELIENYINNNFKEYIDQLDDVRKIYQDEINAISKSIQGGKA